MRAEPIQRLQAQLPQWLRTERRFGRTTNPAANDALVALERGAARASATLQRAARNAANALHGGRGTGLRSAATAGAGLGALRLARAHPALTAGIALGAVGIAVLLWRRRHAQQEQARPQPTEYEPEYL